MCGRPGDTQVLAGLYRKSSEVQRTIMVRLGVSCDSDVYRVCECERVLGASMYEVDWMSAGGVGNAWGCKRGARHILGT
jgi:hypothetical protein